MSKKWYHESGQGQFMNKWSLAHFLFGIASYKIFKNQYEGLVWHTLYEFLEQDLYPIEDRDTSMTNHVGDTVFFLAGSLAATSWTTKKQGH